MTLWRPDSLFAGRGSLERGRARHGSSARSRGRPGRGGCTNTGQGKGHWAHPRWGLGLSRPRIVDKNLGNVFYIGFMAIALPGATIIRCRRDPLDVCVSAFGQNYSVGAEFSFNLTDIANYHVI